MIAEVALNLPLRRTFDYLVDPAQEARVLPGSRVIVPFGRRLTGGVVVNVKAESAVAPDRLRNVALINEYVPSGPMLLQYTE